MSGIRTGTRLQNLQQLRRRAQHELDAARRRDDRHDLPRLRELVTRIQHQIDLETPAPATPTPAGTPRLRSQKATDRVTRRLNQLGVTSHDVKEWAVTAGLLDRVRRGRIRAELVEAYANRTTHPKEPTR